MQKGFLLRPQPPPPSGPPPTFDRKLSLDDIEVDRLIGEGNFSKVFAVTHKETGHRYAMKTIEIARMKQLKKEREVLMEKHCLIKLNPHAYFDQTKNAFPKSVLQKAVSEQAASLDTQQKPFAQALHGCEHILKLHHTFKGDLEVYFLMELCEGDELWSRSKGIGFVSRDAVIDAAGQIISALTALAAANIVHRDLKAENVMVTSGFKMKLIDFGSAMDASLPAEQTLAGQSKREEGRFKYFVGTPNFMAPEATRNAPVTHAADLWSLGGLIYQVATGGPPFAAPSDFLVFARSEFRDLDVPCYLDPLLLDAVEALMHFQPESRIALETLQHKLGLDRCDCPCGEPESQQGKEERIVKHWEPPSGLEKHFRLKWQALLKGLQDIVVSSASAGEIDVAWLSLLYPWTGGEGKTVSLVLKGEACRAFVARWEQTVLSPGSQGWQLVFTAFEETAEIAKLQSGVQVVEKIEAEPDNTRRALDLLVRLAYDGLRRQASGDREDDFYTRLAQRWLQRRDS